MRYFLSILLLAAFYPALAHDLVYVNTNNLVLRDRPEKIYNVFAILQATCPLRVEPYEDGYKNDRAVKAKFYQVSFSFNDKRGINHFVGGWVEKRYVVSTLDAVKVPGVDKSETHDITELMAIADHNLIPYKSNAAQYPSPKYKGGEDQPLPVKRAYHKGSRGGCYYINQKGKKVYVDKSNCLGN